MGKEENRCFTIIILVIVLCLSSIPLSRSSEANGPFSGIVLQQTEIVVRHENFTGAYGYLWGEVIIQAPFREDNEFYYARLTVDSPFSSSKIPLLVFTTRIRIQNFAFSIKVPFNTARDETCNVTVTGRYGFDKDDLNMTLSSSSCIVYIARYYAWNVTGPGKIKIRAGNEKKVMFNTTNIGNGMDNMRIVVLDLDKYTDRGWSFHCSMDKCYTSAGRWKMVPLFIEIPDEEKPGTYDVNLAYASTLAESLGEISDTGNHTLEIEVLNNYKDEVIKAAYIAVPMVLILMMACLISFFRRRKKK